MTQGQESRKRQPIYSIDALLGEVLETSAICGLVLGFHASLSSFCGDSCVGSLQDFVPRLVVAAASGLVSGYLAVLSPFRVCVAVFTATWPVFAALFLVKFLLTDSKSELAVAISASQRLVSILALYRVPMSSVASSVALRL
jgi:hypothetical protein